jgi:hypothetical protein
MTYNTVKLTVYEVYLRYGSLRDLRYHWLHHEYIKLFPAMHEESKHSSHSMQCQPIHAWYFTLAYRCLHRNTRQKLP